jgi:hypothetical protein
VIAYQSVNFAGDGSMKDTYFANGKYVIEISFYDTNFNIQDHAKNKAIFEKMLLSFKFTNSGVEKTQSNLGGIWQASGGMAAGWNDRYHFYTDGNYHFYPNQMVKSDLIEKSGTWQIKNNKLILDGKAFTLEFLDTRTGDVYQSIRIAGKQYWKFSNDPAKYGDEQFPLE